MEMRFSTQRSLHGAKRDYDFDWGSGSNDREWVGRV